MARDIVLCHGIRKLRKKFHFLHPSGAEMPNEAANVMDPISIDHRKTSYPVWHSQPVTFNEVPAGAAGTLVTCRFS